MVKKKAPPDPVASLLQVWFLSLSLSLSPADAIYPEGTPGSCWGWTPGSSYETCPIEWNLRILVSWSTEQVL